MVYRKINYGGKRKEIRTLIRKKQDLLRKIRYYNLKIELHKEKIEEIETYQIIDVENELNKLLDRIS